MGIAAALGLLAVLGLVAAASGGKRQAPKRALPSPTNGAAAPPPQETGPPAEPGMPAAPPAQETPEQRIREGRETSEDLEGVADKAEQEGAPPEITEGIREKAKQKKVEEESAKAVQDEAVEKEVSLEAELSRLPEQQADKFRQVLDNDEPTKDRISSIRQLAKAMEKKGFVALPKALREHAVNLAAALETEGEPVPEKEPDEPDMTFTQEEAGITEPETDEGEPPPPPDGFDPKKATRLAPAVQKDVSSKDYNYSRDLLKKFQTAAGIGADGIYGPGSRGALIFYGVKNARKALFDPEKKGTVPYPENLKYWAKQEAANA